MTKPKPKMIDVPIDEVDVEGLGPAMLALTDRQRRFVRGYLKSGAKNATRVARQAGFEMDGEGTKTHAYWLLHNVKVIAAMREEKERDLNGPMVIHAITQLELLAKTGDKKVKAKAIDSILDRTGFGRQTNQQISMQVEHVDTRGTVEIMAELRKLLPNAGLPVIEGEYETVDATKEG